MHIAKKRWWLCIQCHSLGAHTTNHGGYTQNVCAQDLDAMGDCFHQNTINANRKDFANKFAVEDGLLHSMVSDN